MNIVVINGTEQKGCTFAMKEIFLTAIGSGNNITEYFLPRDCPVFCTGCKACFFRDIKSCPHSQYTVPIWESILSADLLVCASPTYVFHVTAQMKALLDHYGTKWMAHSPEQPMFVKQAVVITNAIGQGMNKTVRDIKDSLDFWGIARTYPIKQALYQAQWKAVDDKRKKAFQSQCERIAAKVKKNHRVTPRLKIKCLFFVMRMAQGMIDKSERKAGREHTKDYLHWKNNGWMDGKKPWGGVRMNNHIIKTTIFRDNPGCKVFLEEMPDGQKHVRKLYADSTNTDREWDALCFLYNAGFNVPKPYKKDKQGIYMQYIDGGILWDSYQTADAATQHALIHKFTKLLYDLHTVIPPNAPAFGGFITNELAEIKAMIEKKQIDKYWEVHKKLTILSAGIKEYPLCYIHRDYHVWNTLLDSRRKLYLIDMGLTQGDYRFDVGWTYMLQSRSAVHDARYGDIAKAFLSAYCALNPNTCDNLEFFMQLANLRWLVNVAPEKNTDKHWFPEMMTIAEQAIAEFLKT